MPSVEPKESRTLQHKYIKMHIGHSDDGHVKHKVDDQAKVAEEDLTTLQVAKTAKDEEIINLELWAVYEGEAAERIMGRSRFALKRYVDAAAVRSPRHCRHGRTLAAPTPKQWHSPPAFSCQLPLVIAPAPDFGQISSDLTAVAAAAAPPARPLELGEQRHYVAACRDCVESAAMYKPCQR